MKIWAILALILFSLSLTWAFKAEKVAAFAAGAMLSFIGAPLGSNAIDQDGVARFVSARDELLELNTQWDNIVVQRGGDGIRVKLGTVYAPPKCEPALCNFALFAEKFVMNNVDDLDIDELEEPIKNLSQELQQADFLAYSANFAEAAGGGGSNAEEYIKKAKTQCQMAEKSIEVIISKLPK